jgi:GT2 family glycosyltransferase
MKGRLPREPTHPAESRSSQGYSVRPTVSVLIPTYRDMQLLAKSLPVFFGRSPSELEITVVNNDPAQDVPTWLESTFSADDRSRVTVIEMGFDSGFARAMNRGISASGGEFLLVCNADLFPAPSYVDEMLEFFAAHAKAGLATGKILRYDLSSDRPKDIFDTTGLVLRRNRSFVARGEGQRDVGQYDQLEEVVGVDGAALFARRAALESITIDGECFDESFFMYKEDWDLSWRVRLAGWECWYVPSAVAFHGRTSRGLGERSYLSGIKLYHENEKAKPPPVRFHSLKNQWLMLVKNEDIGNFLRDLPFILSREALVVGYNLVFAPRTLLAVAGFFKLLRSTLAKRRLIKAAQVMPPGELRRWLAGSGARADRA